MVALVANRFHHDQRNTGIKLLVSDALRSAEFCLTATVMSPITLTMVIAQMRCDMLLEVTERKTDVNPDVKRPPPTNVLYFTRIKRI